MAYDFNQMNTQPLPGVTAGNAQDPVFQQNLSNLVASGARPDLAPQATVPSTYQAPGTPTAPTAAPAAPLVPTTSVTANLPATIPSTALTQNVTFQDIQKLMAENTKLQQQYIASLTPTTEEQAAQKELMNINQTERQELFNNENRFAPTFSLQGRGREIQSQAALSRLAKSEELQAYTGQRQSKLDTLKASLGFGQQNIEQLLGVDEYFRGIEKENRDEARNVLATIIEGSGGMTWDQLSPEEQSQLNELAKSTGLGSEAIKKSLEANAVAQQEETLKLMMDMGVTSRLVNVGGTVWDLFQRKPLNLTQFQEATGQQVGLPPEQTNFSMVAELPTAQQELDTEVIIGAGGRSLLIDKQTGEVLQDYGSRSGGSGVGQPTRKANTVIQEPTTVTEDPETGMSLLNPKQVMNYYYIDEYKNKIPITQEQYTEYKKQETYNNLVEGDDETRLNELITKSNGGVDLDNLTQAEQFELFNLLD